MNCLKREAFCILLASLHLKLLLESDLSIKDGRKQSPDFDTIHIHAISVHRRLDAVKPRLRHYDDRLKSSS